MRRRETPHSYGLAHVVATWLAHKIKKSKECLLVFRKDGIGLFMCLGLHIKQKYTLTLQHVSVTQFPARKPGREKNRLQTHKHPIW